MVEYLGLYYAVIAVLNGIMLTNSAYSDVDPKFSAPITNITVPVGREAVLTCYVHDLVLFKVAWLRVDTQTILTIQNHIITKNHRIGITHTEKRIWQLRIRDVKESDKGWYMCQINTDPMKSQTGYLDVVVPPDIIDQQTSQDIIVQEGENVTLTCVATGLPTPTVTWKREHSKALFINNNKEGKVTPPNVYSFVGSLLQIPQISKFHMGVFLCIASNGIPPTVSKRVMVVVNFKPKIWVHSRHIHASVGQKITLECQTESNPNSVNYWMRSRPEKSNQDFVLGGNYETMVTDNIYKVKMKLVFRPIKSSDFGIYKCIAKNSVGTSEEIIKVYPKSKIVDSNNYHQSNYLGAFILKNDSMLHDFHFNDVFSGSSITASFNFGSSNFKYYLILFYLFV